jgi:hypothetical protein
VATNIVVPIVRRNQKYDILKLVEWKAEEGAEIKQGDVVLIAESDKSTHDIEAEANGFLHIVVPAGEKAMVNTVVGVIASTKDELVALRQCSSLDLI